MIFKNFFKFFIFLIIPLYSCISVPKVVNEKIYETELLSKIKSWNINLKYESITIEREDEDSKKNIKEGYSKYDIQFLEDLFFMIKDSGKINISRKNNEGFIYLNILRPSDDSQLIDSVDITFLNDNDIVLSRVKFQQTGIFYLDNKTSLDQTLYLMSSSMINCSKSSTKVAGFYQKKVVPLY